MLISPVNTSFCCSSDISFWNSSDDKIRTFAIGTFSSSNFFEKTSSEHFGLILASTKFLPL